MLQIKSQPAYYVSFFEIDSKYKTIADVMTHFSAELSEHVARSNTLHRAGKLAMAGAFLDMPDKPLTTMCVCYTKEEAEEFAKGDPFVINGVVTNWYVRQWGNILSEGSVSAQGPKT